MGCCGSTTEETTIPEASKEETEARAKVSAMLDVAAKNSGYTYKKIETVEYENPDLVEQHKKGVDDIQKQIDEVEADKDNVGRWKAGAYETKITYLYSELEKRQQVLFDEQQNSTTSTEYKVMQLAPDDMQAVINTLSSSDQQRINDAINNYGYGSTEYYKAASSAKISPEVAAQYGIEQPTIDAGVQTKIDTLQSQYDQTVASMKTSATPGQKARLLGQALKQSKMLTDARSAAGATELTLSSISQQQAMQQVGAEQSVAELKSKVIARVTDFLDGKLIDLPPETLASMNSAVEASFEPAIRGVEESYAKLGYAADEAKIKAQNFIKEQGIQALTDIDSAREATRVEFSRLTGDDRQYWAEWAAASGRAPNDIFAQQAMDDRLGTYLTQTEGALTAQELGAKRLTQQQLAGVETTTAEQQANLLKEKEYNLRTLGANKAATSANQIYAAQMGLPQQGISSGQSQMQIGSALDTQRLANAMSIGGGYSSLGSMYQTDRLAQPTTTTTQSFGLGGALGILAGGASAAGGLMTGIGAL